MNQRINVTGGRSFRVSLLLCLASSACTRAEGKPGKASANGTVGVQQATRVVANAVKPQPWLIEPFKKWPQMVLTNHGEFRGHSTLTGGSSFLVMNEEGVVVAITARHLIGSAGGVEPPLSVRELDAAMVSWKVFPRTFPKKSIDLGGVAVDNLDAKDRDWLVLKVKSSAAKLPSKPLRLRREPVVVGESIYLLGSPYSEPKATQNVYKGKVTARFRRDYWRFDIDPPVEIPGFSGAPILDANGYVVGLMTVWFEPKMSGKKWLEAGGEDVGPIFEAVEGLRGAVRPRPSTNQLPTRSRDM